MVFHSLTKADIDAIMEIQIAEVAKRLADRRITIEVTDSAKALLGELGYDPSFGARPLKRLIQQKIDNALAEKILLGQVADGDHLIIDGRGKTFTFTTQRDKSISFGEGNTTRSPGHL